jgi:hypothetical protein
MTDVESNVDQILSLSFRPQTLDELIGQKRTSRISREHYKQGRSVPAWMFVAESGGGKTTLARIIALSLQCRHQTVFGNPCLECQKNRSQFDIIEINASDVSGVNEIGSTIAGFNYMPRSPSRKRVYILDEAQMLSPQAQNMLLKPFEDAPKSTVWMICTTAPDKIIRTLRRRCLTFTIPGLGLKGIEALVTAAIKKGKGSKPAGPLAEALMEHGITSPGFVVMAVEKYLAGEEPDSAAQIGLESTVDTLRICRAMVKGDWETIRKEMASATSADSRAIRGSVAGYLRTILVSSEAGGMALKAADALLLLGRMPFDEAFALPWTAAALYDIAKKFRR